MSGTGPANQELDARRRRLRFRAWHRGMREMDLVLGPFADAAVAGFSEDEVALFEALMEAPDPDLYSWITGAAAAPTNFDTALFKRLCAFHFEGQGR
jgi:antitoxin CptB